MSTVSTPVCAVSPQMSERFSECQDFIQQQEQEFMRLKLQHALDVKVGYVKLRFH